KFALFFLAEYVNIVTISAMATTLFLGGWHAPWPLAGGPLDTGWWGAGWFLTKLLVFLFVFIWLRGTLPRLRYDQFMALGWKVLVPGSLVWIVLVSGVRALRQAEVTRSQILVIGGILLGVLVIIAYLLPSRRVRDEEGTVQTAGSDYPVPPLDLVVPSPPPRRHSLRGEARAQVGAAPQQSTSGPSTSQEGSDGTA
ncbi:MAG TPA: NADH-quinone oxidoreductase subunit H, partial [Pseudonocardiaceae bacterium]|nr:NADH-quinone oxidoreductase subunit H [Pseudonocardiaceae bacterium]